ncbi:MAG: hypothetical protein FJ403_10515 [Verrucomicrobia bacterium]|nr:hypothetical protein [Verrucomicrobiota bacterium]
MKRDVSLIKLLLAVAVILTTVAGCQKKASSEGEKPATFAETAQKRAPDVPPPQKEPAAAAPKQSPSSAPAARAIPPEPPVKTPEAALQKLTANSGLAFAADTKVMSYSDGGVPDPSVGFYEWVVVSPAPLALPGGRQIGDPGVSALSLPDAVQLVESKINGAKIENPQAAFSMSWNGNGFQFSGTWVRTQSGDYLIVQQVRQ